MKSNYIKSPMNYTGNKYKLLSNLYSHFPKNIDCFLDLFCGGGDVCANYSSPNLQKVYANDINYHVIEIYQTLQILTRYDFEHGMDIVMSHFSGRINQYGLSKTNEEGFKRFRSDYNNDKMPCPLDLFLLICYSFNHQVRFNNKHEYNSSFGRNIMDFNDTIRENLVKFTKAISNIEFFKQDFTDFDYSLLDKYSNSFVYADPPYSLGCATYNDGKRGFKGWSAADDISLFAILDKLSDKSVKFALSNVIEHKGETNELLANWVEVNGYNLIPINYNYDNCNYQTKNKNYTTREVLVTNY